jgi:ABC-type nickel/cobalt efflux system permease component RcnA
LGGLALFASAYVSQQAISRFLQLPSGLLVLIVGLYVLRDAWRMFQHGSHNHQHVHRHDDPAGSDTPPSLGLLVTLGISGGLVPCPTALAILLAAIGDGRVTLGLLSVIVFSLGLTVVLVAIGLVMVSATALAHDHLPGMGLARWARLASGLIVTGLGVYLVVEAFIYQGWWR